MASETPCPKTSSSGNAPPPAWKVAPQNGLGEFDGDRTVTGYGFSLGDEAVPATMRIADALSIVQGVAMGALGMCCVHVSRIATISGVDLFASTGVVDKCFRSRKAPHWNLIEVGVFVACISRCPDFETSPCRGRGKDACSGAAAGSAVSDDTPVLGPDVVVTQQMDQEFSIGVEAEISAP